MNRDSMVAQDRSDLRLGAFYIGDGVYLNKRKSRGDWVLFVDNGFDISDVIYIEQSMVDTLFSAFLNFDKLREYDK